MRRSTLAGRGRSTLGRRTTALAPSVRRCCTVASERHGGATTRSSVRLRLLFQSLERSVSFCLHLLALRRVGEEGLEAFGPQDGQMVAPDCCVARTETIQLSARDSFFSSARFDEISQIFSILWKTWEHSLTSSDYLEFQFNLSVIPTK